MDLPHGVIGCHLNEGEVNLITVSIFIFVVKHWQH